MIKKASADARKDQKLRENFQFGLLDDPSMANSIVMGELSVPSNLL